MLSHTSLKYCLSILISRIKTLFIPNSGNVPKFNNLFTGNSKIFHIRLKVSWCRNNVSIHGVVAQTEIIHYDFIVSGNAF